MSDPTRPGERFADDPSVELDDAQREAVERAGGTVPDDVDRHAGPHRPHDRRVGRAERPPAGAHRDRVHRDEGHRVPQRRERGAGPARPIRGDGRRPGEEPRDEGDRGPQHVERDVGGHVRRGGRASR